MQYNVPFEASAFVIYVEEKVIFELSWQQIRH